MLGEQKLMAFLVTGDAEKARDFYQNILGLKLIEEHEFAIVFDAFGIELRLQKSPDHTPLPQTALGWSVTDISDMISQLVAKGIEMVRYDGFGQDEAGIWHAPGGAGRKFAGLRTRTATCCHLLKI